MQTKFPAPQNTLLWNLTLIAQNSSVLLMGTVVCFTITQMDTIKKEHDYCHYFIVL